MSHKPMRILSHIGADCVLRCLCRMESKNAYGVYFIFQEHGARIDLPHHRAEICQQDPNDRIIANQRSRFTHYYFYIRDEVLGPIVMCVGSLFPFKTTCYLNAKASSSTSSIRRISASARLTMRFRPLTTSQRCRRRPIS